MTAQDSHHDETISRLLRTTLASLGLGEPTQEQRDAFNAWFKAETNGGITPADRQRELALVEAWRALHPGFSPGPMTPMSNRSNGDDDSPF